MGAAHELSVTAEEGGKEGPLKQEIVAAHASASEGYRQAAASAAALDFPDTVTLGVPNVLVRDTLQLLHSHHQSQVCRFSLLLLLHLSLPHTTFPSFPQATTYAEALKVFEANMAAVQGNGAGAAAGGSNWDVGPAAAAAADQSVVAAAAAAAQQQRGAASGGSARHLGDFWIKCEGYFLEAMELGRDPSHPDCVQISQVQQLYTRVYEALKETAEQQRAEDEKVRALEDQIAHVTQRWHRDRDLLGRYEAKWKELKLKANQNRQHKSTADAAAAAAAAAATTAADAAPAAPTASADSSPVVPPPPLA